MRVIRALWQITKKFSVATDSSKLSAQNMQSGGWHLKPRLVLRDALKYRSL